MIMYQNIKYEAKAGQETLVFIEESNGIVFVCLCFL